jgi:hypothetical protein
VPIGDIEISANNYLPPQWSQTQLLQHGLRQSAHKDHGRIGLDRLTEILPSAALSIEDYRAIPKLLSDKVTAKFLQHRKTIDSVMIAGLFALPSALRRPAIFKLFDRCQRMDRFAHGLRFLGERTGLSFDGLVNELSALDQTEQVIARITEIVESLPLPELPPLVVGSLYRVDRATEIRSLAKTWHNCLADYLFNIKRRHCGRLSLVQWRTARRRIRLTVRPNRLAAQPDQRSGQRRPRAKPCR